MGFEIYLVRHGETVSNRRNEFDGGVVPGSALSGEGRRMALTLQGRFKHVSPFERVITSNQTRSIETAEIATELLKGEFQIEPSLRERSDGLWDRKRKDEISPELLQSWRDGAYVPEEGETFEDLRARVVPTFEGIVRQGSSNGQPILVVTSGNPIRTILAEILKIPVSYQQDLSQDNCGISIIRIGSPRRVVICINDVRHLAM